MIQRQIEHVEVPEALVGGDAGGRAAQEKRHALLADAAVGAERGVEPGQVVARPAGADDHVTLGDRDEVTHPVGRQPASRPSTTSMPGSADTRSRICSASVPAGRYTVANEPRAPWCTT